MDKKNWQEKFDEKFPFLNETRYTPNGSYELLVEIKDFISEILSQSYLSLEGEIGKLEKKQLDKNDPDNYGACYAIGGFNDALSKAIHLLQDKRKNL